MFTGIITDLGKVIAIDKSGDRKLRIETKFDMSKIHLGDSIACGGVCLTVMQKDDTSFSVQVSQETLDKTAIGTWEVGTKINLESSLKMGDPLGGHLVFGHVDGLAEVVGITPSGDCRHVTVRLPQHLKQYAAPKGSIALDGISLTVNDVQDDLIHLMIIPHTQAVTSWSELRVGQKIHVEIDMLARYVVSTYAPLQARNKRVEADKAWETSALRRSLIAAITYVVAALFMYLTGSSNYLTSALVPVMGYLLSTTTLPFVKAWYIRKKGN